MIPRHRVAETKKKQTRIPVCTLNTALLKEELHDLNFHHPILAQKIIILEQDEGFARTTIMTKKKQSAIETSRQMVRNQERGD